MDVKSLGKFIFKILGFLTRFLLIVAGFNFIFNYFSKKLSGLDSSEGRYYSWRLGKIFYKQTGQGPSVVIIHSLEPSSAALDLKAIQENLSEDHTVYALDLLGFGLSDKPWLTYTNYLYVLLINSFIKDVVRDKNCDIIAFESACTCALQAHHMAEGYSGRVILVKPFHEAYDIMDAGLLIRVKRLLELPLCGTFLYNIFCLGGRFHCDAEGKHVFLSRISGHLKTDLSGCSHLMEDDVVIIDD